MSRCSSHVLTFGRVSQLLRKDVIIERTHPWPLSACSQFAEIPDVFLGKEDCWCLVYK